MRTEVGDIAPVAGATYTAVRDALIKEQQISTIMEAGADRVISVRNYSLAATIDTTWKDIPSVAPNGDQHTTVWQLDVNELSGRGGTWAPTCQ